ncbi:5-adenylylsulfate reductase-like protein [Medicago truncatula]|uniref:5-adenylylsulfate reductase-like protein n=2 Tax=Medicago truncatula TaxID=3880 RepID=G7KPL3_MEDTR|nr:5-adenylylsulfate reductase-like protein [Medicago truncatula]
MASPLLPLLLSITAFSVLQSTSASACIPPPPSFLFHLQSQCPTFIQSNPPLQVDGNFIDEVLSGRKMIESVSILFYASWCPFSCRMLPKFEALSSMFPEIEHLVIEQSSALPSLYSKYGIHRLPSIILVNQTSRLRYRGRNDILSLVEFYESNTRFEASSNIAIDQPSSMMSEENFSLNLKSLMGLSLKETLRREPYLVFSVMFICLRILLFVFPKILSRLRAFWVSCIPHLNMQIFGETSQVMGRVLQVIDVRRIWTKLGLCKTRNFHERARSARVWASSLASVSLGESSSAR